MFGNAEVCEDCDIAKAKQKSVNKVRLGSSNIPGETIYIDIGLIKERSLGGAKFRTLVVDDFSDYYWSLFLRNKSYLKTKIINLLTDLKISDGKVKFIRCDETGENRYMIDGLNVKCFGVKFEFSGSRTP
jgi:hypothetical protein